MTDRLPVTRPFVLLTLVVLPLGAASLVYSWLLRPPQLGPPLLLLILAAMLSENFAFALPEYSVSLSYPLAMAAIILGGPSAAGLVVSSSFTNYREIKLRRPLVFLAFNLGQVSLVWTTGAFVFQQTGGRFMTSPHHLGLEALHTSDFPQMLLPLIVVAVWCASWNMLLTACAAASLGIQPLGKQLLAMSAFMPTQIAMAFVGYSVAQVIALNVFALPLFVAPLLVARQLYLRYAGLKAAYIDTVRSLVSALEAKDPYTRGHSERVSTYADELGRAIGLRPRVLERLVYAALLHDLGKLAVSASILTKPGRLEAEEMARIREHPSRGAAMMSRIPPLQDLVPAVGQHHERIDGKGYPNGLPGSALTREAKILAVADSYDAMTSTRAYRPALSREQAITELLEGAGTQFDAAVVDAFIEAQVGAPHADDMAERAVGTKPGVD